MRILSWCCFLGVPATAQLLSLPPALQSIAGALQSLADPSHTPKPTPTPKAKTTPAPPPKPKAGPPVQTSSSPPSTSSSSSSAAKTLTSSTSTSTSTGSTSTTSTPPHTTSTLLNNAQPAATPTHTASSAGSGGLSQSAKTGIGVGIGLFVICGLLAAALYSFVRDRHSSEAYAAWRERRRAKHGRLGSSSSNFFRGAAKEMELSHVEHGNGTVLGRPTVAPCTTPAASQSSASLDKDLPAPPVTYQQAKPVHIKRKPVPPQKPRFSWMP